MKRKTGIRKEQINIPPVKRGEYLFYMFSGGYADNGCSGSGPIMKSVKSIALSEAFLFGYSVRGRRGKG